MKGVSEIVAVVIIVLLSLTFFSAAYLWGKPLIEKRQYAAEVDRIASIFSQQNALSLPSKIEYVANKGGQEVIKVDTQGAWRLNETANYIEFSFFSKTTPYAANAGWVSLTPNADCPPSSGIVGQDKSSVVCVRADTAANGYQLTFRVYFRDLVEAATGKTYRIKLVKHPGGPLVSSTKTVYISRGQTTQTQQLIETNVIILFG